VKESLLAEISEQRGRGGHNKTEYHLTLNAARRRTTSPQKFSPDKKGKSIRLRNDARRTTPRNAANKE
jgi:hypothetical protein